MTNIILSIYILEKNGNPFFMKECYKQGTENIDHALLSNFINALQTFALEYGEKETRVIEMKNEIIFILKDNRYSLQFILKCTKDAKSKKMFKFLNNIKESFLNIFSTYFEVNIGDKDNLIKKFTIELNKLLEPLDNFENFFKTK